MTRFIYFLFILIQNSGQHIEGARILGIFPMPARSHLNCNEAIMASLVAAGHNVTIVTSLPELLKEKNYAVIGVSNDIHIYMGQANWRTLTERSTYRAFQMHAEIEMQFCNKILELKEFQSIINSKEKLFDVVFIEQFVVSKCYQFIAEKMRVPIIGTVTLRSWLLADRAIGNPFHPSYTPIEQTQKWNHNDFPSRLINLWNVLQIYFYWYTEVSPFLNDFHNENKNLLGDPTYLHLTPSLIFYNSFPEYLPRPMNPNAIQIGGIHVQPEKPLPTDLRNFIEEAEHGVILMSFGSIIRADSFEKEKLTAFATAFAEIPQRVIWKFETQLENVSSNVLLRSWIPQRDILAHKNVVAFITHAGQGGIYEAIYSGKPMICIPLFADQKTNAFFLERLNLAVGLDVYSVSKRNIVNALTIVISEEYRKNAEELSYMVKNRPMSPQETVVYWTEYVIRHSGAPHLQTAATELNWFQCMLLDVICFVLLVFLAYCYATYRIIKMLLSVCKFSYIRVPDLKK